MYSSLIFGSFSQRFRQKIPALGSIRSQLKSQHFDTLSQESTGWAVDESIYVLIFPVWHPKSAQIPNFRQIHPNSRQFFSKNRHCVPNFRQVIPGTRQTIPKFRQSHPSDGNWHEDFCGPCQQRSFFESLIFQWKSIFSVPFCDGVLP